MKIANFYYYKSNSNTPNNDKIFQSLRLSLMFCGLVLHLLWIIFSFLFINFFTRWFLCFWHQTKPLFKSKISYLLVPLKLHSFIFQLLVCFHGLLWILIHRFTLKLTSIIFIPNFYRPLTFNNLLINTGIVLELLVLTRTYFLCLRINSLIQFQIIFFFTSCGSSSFLLLAF